MHKVHIKKYLRHEEQELTGFKVIYVFGYSTYKYYR